jgi:methionyl-tRNA synthetase
MKNYDLKHGLDCTFKFLDAVNLYVTQTEPWTLMKDESKSEEVQEIMYTICESLRQVGMNLFPYFPEKMAEMFAGLGLEKYSELLEEGGLEELRNKKETFKITQKCPILFQKFEIEE